MPVERVEGHGGDHFLQLGGIPGNDPQVGMGLEVGQNFGVQAAGKGQGQQLIGVDDGFAFLLGLNKEAVDVIEPVFDDDQPVTVVVFPQEIMVVAF